MLALAFADKAKAAETAGASYEEVSELLGRGRARRGTFLGDTEEGIMEAGEVAGDIHDIPPAGEVVYRIVQQYAGVVHNLPR
jgi:enoyl-[acyl-carrier protein] reductase II